MIQPLPSVKSIFSLIRKYFLWCSGSGYGFWITFPFPSPLNFGDLLAFLIQSLADYYELAKRLTREWIHSILGAIRQTSGSELIRKSGFESRKGKKVWKLVIAPLTWVRLVTSSALQSRKWQLIGMSQWCRSALCGHPLPALTDNWTHGAASRHTIAPISHTRPSPRSRSYYSFPIPLRVGGWVGLST